MQATQVSLNTFLHQPKTQFIIPVYQRNYDWTEAQCAQMFNDIWLVGQSPGNTHFIGSIVFIHDGVYSSSDVRQLVVIDGQQRLTTFSLLYLALYKFALAHGHEEKASEIKETYIINKFVKDDDSKLKLKQSDNNARAFKFLLSGNESSQYGQFSRVIDNYIFFQKSITEANFDAIIQGLSALLFVEISLERGKDDPQRIFESLNSTGLELSQADLIRNYILMGLPPNEQTKIYEKYWEVIEKNCKVEEREESRISDFIRDYLTFKSKKIPAKEKVYENFKLRFSMKDAHFYKTVLPEMRAFSFYYGKFLNPSREEHPDLRKELQYIQKLEINVAFPFLMPVFDDYSKDMLSDNTLRDLLRLVQSFVWRRFIVGLATNALNKIFLSLYSEIDEQDYFQSAARALLRKKATQRFPSDSEITVALAEKDLYNTQSKNRLYLFELLENHNNREYVNVDSPEITVEHIYPQTPDEKWNNALTPEAVHSFKEKYLNTIGNLTLSGNNGSLSNKSFLEKRDMNREGKQQGYSYSRLWLNQYLRGINEWNLEHLQARYRLLLNRFIDVWPYPEVSIDDEIDLDQDYTISNAPDPKSRKLDYFIFKDEKIETQQVATMFYHVVKALFLENPTLFYHHDIRSVIGLSSDPTKLREPYPLSSNYFIESNIDNVSKFRRLRILLERFGYQDELLINFSNYDPDDVPAEMISREYWVRKATPAMLSIVDYCDAILKSIDNSLKTTYTGAYIGIARENNTKNFALFFPLREHVRVALRISETDYWIERIKSAGLESLGVNKKNGRLRFKLRGYDQSPYRSLLVGIFTAAYTAAVTSENVSSNDQSNQNPESDEYDDAAGESIGSSEDIKARHLIRLEFWKQFLQEMNLKSAMYNNVSPSKDNWITGRTGLSGVNLNSVISNRYARSEVYIQRRLADENKEIFDELLNYRNEIENQFGSTLIWERLDQKKACRIKFQLDDVDYLKKDDWPKMISFMVDGMTRLEMAFKGPIARIRLKLKSAED